MLTKTLGKPLKSALTAPLFYTVTPGIPGVATGAKATVVSVYGITPPPIQEEVSVRSRPWVNFFQELHRVVGLGNDYVGFSPTITDLTISVGGTVTVTGEYYFDKNMLHFLITIVPDGVGTTSSVAGTTYVSNLPVTASNYGQVTVLNATTKQVIGTGLIDIDTTNAYLPTWSTLNDTVVLFGNYFIER